MDNDNKHDDDDAMIRRLQPRPSSSSRPLLIFNHNPKAVLKTIRGFKMNEIQCRSGNRKESGCTPNQWDRINRIISLSSNLKNNNNNSSSSLSSFSSNNNNNNNNTDDTINNTFIHIGEFSRTTTQDKERGYIIGTIREPCSQYVSLWSFGSFNNGGAFRNYQVRDTELYGKSPPYFNTTEDILRFQKWMNHPLVIGEIGRRVTASYGNNDDYDNDNSNDNDNNNSNSIVNNVDCWVVVENFQQTLFDCLLKYENQGGYVDWTSTTVSQLKDKIQEKEEEENNNSYHDHHSRRHLGRNSRSHSREFKRFYNKGSKKRKNDHSKDDHSKDDPLGDPRSQHHASCHIFFATTTTTQNDDDNNDTNNSLIQQVMSPENELFIYQQFGYDGCCTTNIPTIVGTTLMSSSAFFDNSSKSKSKSSSNNTETEFESTTGDSDGVSSSSSSFSSSPPPPTTTTTTMNNASFLPSTSSILIFNKHKNNTPTTTTSIGILISFLFAGGFFIMIYRLRGWIDNLSCSSSRQQRSSKSS